MLLKSLRPLLRINVSSCMKKFNSTLSYKIVLTDDKSTFVSWHPEVDFPYECSKPLPVEENEDHGVLKTQLTPKLKEVFNKKTPEQTRQELMNITHTTKHRWFPRSRDKRAKKTPMDREYL